MGKRINISAEDYDIMLSCLPPEGEKITPEEFEERWQYEFGRRDAIKDSANPDNNPRVFFVTRLLERFVSPQPAASELDILLMAKIQQRYDSLELPTHYIHLKSQIFV